MTRFSIALRDRANANVVKYVCIANNIFRLVISKINILLNTGRDESFGTKAGSF